MRKSFSIFRIIIVIALMLSYLPVSTLLPIQTAQASCAEPANEIEAENCLEGSPASEWDIEGAGDPSIQGFATDISVNRGSTISFKIDTTAAAYDIRIYRLGYYGGDGARLVHTIEDVTGTDQPACNLYPIPMGGGATTSGQLLDCGNWMISASWVVPETATSGVYIAGLALTENSVASHIPFIVRDDASDSDLLFQTSDTTWQSYNPYGGYNAYGSSGATMAEKLSYNRPFTTRGAELENYLFNAEYPMIRWLERNGYDVSYMSATDIERYSSLLLNHKVYLSVGHDEYWSQGRRDAVTAARNAGVHLAFFSGNEIYWKIRWEASTADGGSTDYRTQVVYKEGSSAPSGSAEHRNCYNNYDCDPSPIWTGQWREAPGSTPENSLSGQISWRLNQESITVPGEYASLRFWRDTQVAALQPAGQLALAYGTLGYEWDPEYPQYADHYPPGRVLLSTTTATSFTGIPEQHHMSLYRAPSGALVFGAGTVQWSWGLDTYHDRDASTEDPNVQQATVNLFADMGVQPASLQTGLVAATGSTDTTPPVVTVTSPLPGASVPGGAVTITGTASDIGGVVGVVEISSDGGTTWRRATGRESWSYTYTAAEGTAQIQIRAVDDSINLSLPFSHSFEVEPRVCPCSLWNDTITPANAGNDGQPIEVGLKFQASEAGRITGLRFYKDPANNGTHTGHLWASDGMQLAEAVFTGESASGWQEIYFTEPVEVQADTTYVASYHSSGGGYSYDDGYFATQFVSSPLRALADGAEGGNGVYKYGTSGFPTTTFNSANYWVDVIYDNTPQTYSIWDQAAITGDPDVDDSLAVELGMKFKSDVPGSVTGLAFYKGAANTGPFLGHLWTLGGTQLAEKSYTNNTAEEGWQVVTFDAPVAINEDTTYVISYYTQSGNYAAAGNYFTGEVYKPPLRALATGDSDGPNGVFSYGTGGGFPVGSFNAGNYWVDVLFTPDAPFDGTPPVVSSVTPADGAGGVNVNNNISARFSEAMDETSIGASTFELRDAGNNPVTASVSYTAATRTAALDPAAALAYSATYTATIKGGVSGVTDLAGNPLAEDYTWNFTTSSPPPPPPDEGPGGPILVIADAGNPFGRYFAEILRTEGLNEFTVTDISNIDELVDFAPYDVVILAEQAQVLTSTQVTLFTDWVNAGGNLIAMRPDPQLASLLGLSGPSGTLSEGYLLVNTTSAPGAGIVGQTIQYHGTADQYALAGAESIASLYSNATTATTHPAVTLRNVGTSGGQAVAFTYDLAKSVVYTRQGNPAWKDINGDASAGPVRADDMFHNGTDPDWVNLDKVAIPQADEQQRLLANLIIQMNMDNLPLPRFWYFPRGEKAVVLMTADDHASSNVAGRFEQYKTASPAGCSVEDWECVRSSVYIYPGSALTTEQAAAYTAEGFEIGVHVDTGCNNYTVAGLGTFYTTQLAQFAGRFPALPPQDSERTHCIAWSGWDYQARVKEQEGIRLDTNYYYWPAAWITNRPGLFTGSGMPMRFAAEDGSMFDVFQATTQMTDESGQTFPYTINTLLDRAIGPEGYYGVFTANMHSDSLVSDGSNAIVASAQARGVPVVSGRQLLTWLDGRNGSSFANLTWSTDTLTFDILVGEGATGLQALLPARSGSDTLASLTLDTVSHPYTLQTIKGIDYAVFDAAVGTFEATYDEDTTSPTVTGVSPATGATDVSVDTTVTATFSEPMNPDTISSATFELRAPGDILVDATVSYDAGTNTAILTPDATLDLNTSYSAIVKGGETTGVTDIAGNELVEDEIWSFTTADNNCPCSIWDGTAIPASSPVTDGQSIEVGTKFRADSAGYITALRFYKGLGDTDTHLGRLWTSTGLLLAEVTSTDETGSGWQEIPLATPVPVYGDTTYIASIFSSPVGYFSITPSGLASAVDNPPLRALASGEDGPNGVYKYGGGFPTAGNNANYWVDVVFTYSTEDTDPPVITDIVATPNTDGTAVITWTTDEPADSLVEYGTDSGLLNETKYSAALVTDHSLSLTGLLPNTSYFFQVTSVDASDNSATSPEPPAAPAQFTTPGLSFIDTTRADFTSGLVNTCYLAAREGGEIILNPTLGTEFDGTSLPSGWGSSPWTGGTSTVSGGLIAVDGARAAPDTYYSAGRSLEFVATFNTATFQNVGFGQSLAVQTGESWAMFGTASSTNTLHARTNVNGTVVDTALVGSWIGSSHRYRIEWNASQVRFYIDGGLVHTADVTITQDMRPVISDYQVGSSSVSVDWMHLSPYNSPCSLESRIFDAGAPANWESLSWIGSLPVGTTATFSYRVGDTASPDSSWTGFMPVATSGAPLGGRGQYAQYKVILSTSNGTVTPWVDQVSLAYNLNADTTPPTIIARSPAPGAELVARNTTVTAQFSELINGSTITNSTFRLRAVGGTSDIPATVSYSGGVATLTPISSLGYGTTYRVTVASSVADSAGNTLGSDITWVFTTLYQTFTDTTIVDFLGGSGTCNVDTSIGDGAVRLAATVDEQFESAWPLIGWDGGPWPGGVAPIVSNDSLVVNVGRAYVNANFTPGHILEFVATFQPEANQHIGFVGDGDFNAPWAIFSTSGAGNGLYARVSSGNDGVPIPGTWLGAPHLYRIEWYTDRIDFYVDGLIRNSQPVTIAGPMRPIASDISSATYELSVDWLTMTPYVQPCTFASRIIDAAEVVEWSRIYWTNLLPAGTSQQVSVRTSTDGITWSEFTQISASGGAINQSSRFIQYQVVSDTTNINLTPVLESVTITANQRPTAVTISSFTAQRQGDAIQLFWETASELDLIGFNLYRSTMDDAERKLLTPAQIPTRMPGSTEGTGYQFMDTDIESGVTYMYWLEVNTRSGSWMVGPVTIGGHLLYIPLISG